MEQLDRRLEARKVQPGRRTDEPCQSNELGLGISDGIQQPDRPRNQARGIASQKDFRGGGPPPPRYTDPAL
jgi:hypothetical protein